MGIFFIVAYVGAKCHRKYIWHNSFGMLHYNWRLDIGLLNILLTGGGFMKGKQILPMLLAVCSSAMTAVGGYCALTLMIMVSWNQTATHPIQTPFNALVGFFSLCFLIFFLFLYVRMVWKTNRRWLLLPDIALYVGLLPVFFYSWAQFYIFLIDL